MAVQCGFGRTRGARCKRHHGDVGGSASVGLRIRGRGGARQHGFQTVVGAAVKRDHGQWLPVLGHGLIQFVGQARVAQGQSRLGFVEYGDQFFGAQQWHGGHRNGAAAHHRQPAQGHGHRIAAPQQHPVAWHQTVGVNQPVTDRMDLGLRLAVAQSEFIAAQQGTVRVTVLVGAGEQPVHHIQVLRPLLLWPVQQHRGHVLGGRQTVKHVAVGRGGGHGNLQRSRPLGKQGGAHFKAALPKISNCTSLAPS